MTGGLSLIARGKTAVTVYGQVRLCKPFPAGNYRIKIGSAKRTDINAQRALPPQVYNAYIGLLRRAVTEGIRDILAEVGRHSA